MFKLIVLVVLAGSPPDAKPREVPLPAHSMYDCNGGGAMEQAAEWLTEHPAYRFIATSCKVGSAATERGA